MVSILDIIGPVMVGPSSSHTAGACRLGLIARDLVAGTPESALIELHGALHEVRCLACGLLEDRTALQQRLQALNPGFSEQSAHLAPDGDADLPVDVLARFVVAGCRSCGGTLKPNVVFFGENVAQTVVARAHAMISGSEVLLVVGSSLTVLSGYRFVRAAARQGIPVAIINLGSTRGDAEATLKVDASAGIMLPLLAAALCTSG